MKNFFRDIRSSLAFFFIPILIIVTSKVCSAQSKNISIGYGMKTYSYTFTANPNYSQEVGSAYKGFLSLNYNSEISDQLFVDISSDFLIPKTEQPLSSGPISFNSANAGISIGAHLGGKLDLLAGVQGGLLWNTRIKSESGAGNVEWLRTEQPHTNFNGALTAGLRYQLLEYVSATASVSKNYYQYSVVAPRMGTTETPAFQEADLSSYSARVGLTLDIPWEANPYDDREPTYRRDAPIVEDRRFSLSYELRNYTYSYLPNSNYSGNLNVVKKGFVRARYKQYLTKNFFMSASGGYVIPSQGGSFFSGGPVNFQATNLDLLMGLRWGRVSLFTGLEGGLLWDMRIKSQNQTSEITWNAPANVKSSFTSAFKAGMEYHVFKNLSVKAKFFYNNYQHSELQPDMQTPETPAINSAELAPFSASVGISVSIPWKSKYNRGAPPPSVGSAGPSPGPTADRTSPGDPGEKSPGEVTQEPELPPVVKRPPESTPAQLSFTNPIPSSDIMTSYFGDQRNHKGLDIDADKGDKIVSVAKGTVVETGWEGGYGEQVTVKHPAGFVSIYAHLSESTVEKGQEVEKGDQVGIAGNTGRSTGPHLHFEIKRMDMPINPRRFIIHDWEFWKPEKK